MKLSIRGLLYLLKNTPPVLQLRKYRFNRYFSKATHTNTFRGLFTDFTAAIKSAPNTKPIGYDHDAAAKMYIERTQTIYPSDYPILFWLSNIFRHEDCHQLLDFGGHIGVSYYAYQKFLRFPDDFTWTIYDLPAILKRAREFSEEKETKNLKFCTDISTVSKIDILLVSGSMQYIETDFADVIKSAELLPDHILVNMTPISDKDDYFTLQSIGTSYCPYRIFNHDKLIRSFTNIGYKLIDEWKNLEKACNIAFEHQYTLNHYTGFYFKKV